MALPGLNPEWVLDWPLGLLVAVESRLRAQYEEQRRAQRQAQRRG